MAMNPPGPRVGLISRALFPESNALLVEILTELKKLNARLDGQGRMHGPQTQAVSAETSILEGSPRNLMHVMTHSITPTHIVQALVAAGQGGFVEIAGNRFLLNVAAGGSDTLDLVVPSNVVVVSINPLQAYFDYHDAAILANVRVDGTAIAENFAITADVSLEYSELYIVQRSFEVEIINGSVNPVEATIEINLAAIERSVYEKVWKPLLIHGYQAFVDTVEQLKAYGIVTA